MKHVVMFSGGVCSWAAAKRVADRHGTADMTLLFADTMIEHADTYRFLQEAAANIGAPLIRIADGRTPFQVFRDERFLGNSRVDPCSKLLKRKVLDRWRDQNCDPNDTILYFGIHWSEAERFDRLKNRLAGWRCEAPMCEAPIVGHEEMQEWAEREGLRRQWLYLIGNAHANCGGGCIKMGQAGWIHCYRTNRATFDTWEREENELRELLGNVSMLKDRAGGTTKPLPLTELRRRIESDEQLDMIEWGGCGCFTGEAA